MFGILKLFGGLCVL